MRSRQCSVSFAESEPVNTGDGASNTGCEHEWKRHGQFDALGQGVPC